MISLTGQLPKRKYDTGWIHRFDKQSTGYITFVLMADQSD